MSQQMRQKLTYAIFPNRVSVKIRITHTNTHNTIHTMQLKWLLLATTITILLLIFLQHSLTSCNTHISHLHARKTLNKFVQTGFLEKNLANEIFDKLTASKSAALASPTEIFPTIAVKTLTLNVMIGGEQYTVPGELTDTQVLEFCVQYDLSEENCRALQTARLPATLPLPPTPPPPTTPPTPPPTPPTPPTPPRPGAEI